MVLPLIPLAIIAGGSAIASFVGGSAVTSFFNAQGKETETQNVLESDLSEDKKIEALAYNNGINPNSQFQVQPGGGIANDYSQYDNRQISEQNTTNNYYVTESPNTQITTDTTQKTDQTSTQTTESSNPLTSFLSGLGGSIIPVALLGVGCLIAYKVVTK